MIVLIILAAIILIMGIIILIGKGDNLIAGYNIVLSTQGTFIGTILGQIYTKNPSEVHSDGF